MKPTKEEVAAARKVLRSEKVRAAQKVMQAARIARWKVRRASYSRNVALQERSAEDRRQGRCNPAKEEVMARGDLVLEGRPAPLAMRHAARKKPSRVPAPVEMPKPTAAQLRESKAVGRILSPVGRRNLPDWGRMGCYVLGCNTKKLALGIIVLPCGPSEYNVTAVSSPMPGPRIKRRDKRVQTTRIMEHVFDEHSHDVVGTFAKLSDALQASERYARAWLKGGAEKARCACKNIRQAS